MDYGSDLQASPSGDFATSDGDVLSRQRVIRKLLNNPRVVLTDGTVLATDYLYDPLYGKGLGRLIGSDIGPLTESSVTAYVNQALAGEDSVDQSQPTSVIVTPARGGFNLNITYIAVASGNRVSLPTLLVA